jgi:hypothetical protein
MATEKEIQSFLQDEFDKVGAEVSVKESIVVVRNGDFEQKYKLPANYKESAFLPGWFAAGIWDDMGLPSVREIPDTQLLNRWNFTHAEGTNFDKPLSAGVVLIYNSSNNLLFVRNTNANSLIEVGPFPTKSIFHAQKLFEENAYFPESRVPIRHHKIDDFRIG